MRRLGLLLIIFLACQVILPQHKNVYVSSGAVTGGNGTFSYPFKTITQGITTALFGDTVHVMEGIYSENIKMANGISLIGDGADKCIFNDSLPELQAADSCTIKGFTFNQTITCIGVSPIISDNIIHTAFAYLPAIRIMSNSSPVVLKNYITGGQVGITMQSGCNPLIYNNIIRTGISGIQSSMHCKSKIINNLIITSSGTVINLVFSDSTTIENNVLYGSPDDTVTGISVINSAGSVISYNDFWNTIETSSYPTGNMFEDPMFINFDSYNYHYKQVSPCKHAGDPNQVYNNLDGSRNDLGVYGGPNGFYEIITTDIKKTIENIPPNDFVLQQNYPNPFNPSTSIMYFLPVECKVLLKVYDIIGREIVTLVNEQQNAGLKVVNFDATNLASGIYFYKLSTGKFTFTRKMMLLK